MTDHKFDKEIYLSLISEKCHRFDDMCSNIEYIIINSNTPPNIDLRNLISSSFKQKLSLLREPLFKLNSIESSLSKKSSFPSEYIDYIHEYKTKITSELLSFCNNVINLIDNHLLPKVIEVESRTFFYTMKADYLRYIAESIIDENKQKTYTDQALETYNSALDASKELDYINAVKLSLMLNVTVFYYEVLNERNKAHQQAVETLNTAKQLLIGSKEDDERVNESAMLVGLIEDNIRMWDIEME